jgi:hypothetical protein
MKIKKKTSVAQEPETPPLGWMEVHDSRLETDHRFPITRLELRGGLLQLQVSAVIEVAGSIRHDDVATILDPGGKVVCRYWLGMGETTINLVPGHQFTMDQRIGLGGPRGVIMGHAAQGVSA